MTDLRALVLTLLAFVASGTASAETFPGESLLLDRLDAKGIAGPARGDHESTEAYRTALGRAHLEALGNGDSFLRVQRFFGRRGAGATLFPTVRAALATEAAFLDRSKTALERDWSRLGLHYETLRAAYAVLPLVVEPAGEGRWRVAPTGRWLLLSLEPDLAPAAEKAFAEPDRAFRRFLQSDAVLEWMQKTLEANAKREALTYWASAWDGHADAPLRTRVTNVLLTAQAEPLSALFGNEWKRPAEKRLAQSLVMLSLTARGRRFLDAFLPLHLSGKLPVRSVGTSGGLCGYYSLATRTLSIGFGLSPPLTAATVIHEATHALDDLINDILGHLNDLDARQRELRARFEKRARQAARAGDDLALRHYARRQAGLTEQAEILDFEESVTTEYCAWRAEGSFESEACFLVLTTAMGRAQYLIDREMFEDTMKMESGYAIDPEIVDACLRAKDWDRPEDLRRPDGWQSTFDPSREPSVLDARGLRRLGDVYRSLDRHDRALACYDRALELDRTLAAAHLGRGFVHTEREAAGLAILAFSRALERAPRMGEALLQRGIALGELASYRRALVDLGRAIEIDGDKQARPWAARGKLHLSRRHFENAIEDLTRAIGHAPKWALLRRLRAEAFRGVGDRGKALGDLDRAVELFPRYDGALVDRAEMRLANGQPTEALEDLDRALDIDDRNARAHELRARALDRLGRTAEAAAARERAATVGRD